MDKMIDIINDNLNSVIIGIKSHRDDDEKKLHEIENTIDEKIKVAEGFKESVDNSKNVISNLEKEITDLENDLKELNVKFSAKNLTEVVAAGNKEIKNKILEKRTLIDSQTQNIMDLTDKVSDLKNELINLNKEKENYIVILKNSNILCNYYESKLKSIMDYAKENTKDLEKYTGIYSEDYNENIEIDNNDLNSNVDDSVFEEIENINIDNIDETSIESLSNFNEEKEDNSKELTVEEKLDNILSSANEIIEKNETNKENIENVVTFKDDLNENISNNDDKIYPDNEINIENNEVVLNEDNNEDLILNNDIFNIDDNSVIDDDELMKIIDGYDDNLNNLNTVDNLIDKEKEEDTLKDFDSYLNMFINPDNKVENKISFKDILDDIGIDSSKFSEYNLKRVEDNFDKENVKDFINVLNKYNYNKEIIYSSVDTFINVKATKLDLLLALMNKIDADINDKEKFIKYLYMIDEDLLDASIRKDRKRELSEILIEAVTKNENIDYKTIFDLEDADVNVLKKSCIGNDFKIITTFTDVVLDNYNYLKNLNINNLKECFTKYPHRFVFNNTNFINILDKYDTDDLIRCINKNAAVINRL